MNDLQKLTNTINEVWQSTYGGEPVTDLFALQMRLKNIAADRDYWVFNANVLQKQVNEFERRECCGSTCTR